MTDWDVWTKSEVAMSGAEVALSRGDVAVTSGEVALCRGEVVMTSGERLNYIVKLCVSYVSEVIIINIII